MITKDRQYRTFEIRAEPDGLTVEGYAAVFDKPEVMYEIEGNEYKEVVDRKSFNSAQMSDVVMNFNPRRQACGANKERHTQSDCG